MNLRLQHNAKYEFNSYFVGQSSLQLIDNIAMGRYHIYQWTVGSFVDVTFDDQQSNQICRLVL